MSGFYKLQDLGKLAAGLNIEGFRPTLNLPPACKWFNIVQVIDEPLHGINFDDIMKKVNDNKYEYIECSIGIDMEVFINQLTKLITDIAKDYKQVLVHVHQFEQTTILHKTLESKIDNPKIKFITDKTHYYEHPVIYKDTYPNIDALISISQCAGFGLKAGTWIVPENFLEYDVTNNIIFTNKTTVENNIKPYVSFDYVEGDILMVNDLWNPDLKKQDGVLLLDKDDESVLSFVKKNTVIFDESHNWQHAIKVAYNSTRILNNKFVLYLALLHDVCDHKYPKALARHLLSKYINEELKMYAKIDDMIEMISFSKQKTFDRVDPILEAVRDGDRLEAIGEIGLIRCIQFVESKNGVIPDDVIQHCYDKLLKIVPDKYIVTEIGLQNAIQHHNVIVEYVHKNINKTKLTYPLPERL